MVTHYSVIKYVPDPVADERINVGVVVIGDSIVRTHFVKDWRRATQFGSEDTKFLRDFVADIEKSTGLQQVLIPEAGHPQTWTVESLRQMAADWQSAIQISEPRVSLRDPTELLTEMTARFLRPKKPSGSSAFSRSRVVRVLRHALKSSGKDQWVETDAVVDVQGEKYQFDLGIKNGRLYYAIELISFKNRDLQRIERTGGWYAHIWPEVSSKTGAKGLLLVERPSNGGKDQRDVYRQMEYDRVTTWAEKAGIDVRPSTDLKQVVSNIAGELS